MANEYAVNKADLVSVADAIRAKGGTSEALTFPGGFVDAVNAIQTGGNGESGGGAQLLYTATITEPVQAVSIPFEESWKDYDAILCVPDVVLSMTEWLCCTIKGIRNYVGTSGSVGLTAYAPERAEIICTFTEDTAFIADPVNSYTQADKAAITDIILNTYYTTNTITSGTIKIMGVKF